jgi:hypothetical protein
MQIKDHHDIPQCDHRRRSLPVRKTPSAMSMPPDLSRGAPRERSDRANHLGKIQTALLGKITPALTPQAAHDIHAALYRLLRGVRRPKDAHRADRNRPRSMPAAEIEAEPH